MCPDDLAKTSGTAGAKAVKASSAQRVLPDASAQASNTPSVPRVYVRPMPSGGWGILRPGDRRPVAAATMYVDAIEIARRYSNTILVLNKAGKVVGSG